MVVQAVNEHQCLSNLNWAETAQGKSVRLAYIGMYELGRFPLECLSAHSGLTLLLFCQYVVAVLNKWVGLVLCFNSGLVVQTFLWRKADVQKAGVDFEIANQVWGQEGGGGA